MNAVARSQEACEERRNDHAGRRQDVRGDGEKADAKLPSEERKDERRREAQPRQPHNPPLRLLRLALRLLRLALRVRDLCEPLHFRALLAEHLGLACLDEIELQRSRRRRILWPGCNPLSRQRDVRCGKKPPI